MTCLAQFNVARARWPLKDPRMEGFMAVNDRLNALGARADGFIWRLDLVVRDGEGIIYDDDQWTWTLSVWRDAETLANFAFNTVHRQYFQRREEWFPPLSHAAIVLWNVDETDRPTLEEGLARKAHLDEHGPTDFAFGWERFPHLRALRTEADQRKSA